MADAKRPGAEPVSGRLWFGMLAPGTAWFIHLVATYILVPWTCMAGGRGLMIGGSAMLACVTIGAGWISWLLWRALDKVERESILGQMEGSRTGFMVFAGLLFSGLFLLAIILGTIPVFVIDPCSPAHSGPVH
ncbi:MAG: hypothetical protein JW954_01120 [Dehalococcoidaceae bacterium]|nr:hypothetical protein [Dehalococcoidaceae bacterium]